MVLEELRKETEEKLKRRVEERECSYFILYLFSIAAGRGKTEDGAMPSDLPKLCFFV